MECKQLFMLSLLVLAILVSFASAQTSLSSGMFSARAAICNILFNIRSLLSYIAAGVGVIVIVLQGIKWTGSADDPGARKQAKAGIINAVVGLIIVMLSVWIVLLVFTGQSCPLGTI